MEHSSNTTLRSIQVETETLVSPDTDLLADVKIPRSGPHFHQILAQHNLTLEHQQPTELQINLGKLCNLACHHCHVDAGPKRTEIMTWEVMQKILNWAKKARIKKADLTGGAPELNPNFRRFCAELIKMGVEITSRCNITVLYEPGQEDLTIKYV